MILSLRPYHLWWRRSVMYFLHSINCIYFMENVKCYLWSMGILLSRKNLFVLLTILQPQGIAGSERTSWCSYLRCLEIFYILLISTLIVKDYVWSSYILECHKWLPSPKGSNSLLTRVRQPGCWSQFELIRLVNAQPICKCLEIVVIMFITKVRLPFLRCSISVVRKRKYLNNFTHTRRANCSTWINTAEMLSKNTIRNGLTLRCELRV